MTPSMLALQRRNLSMLLQSLGALTAARAAELAGLDPSTLSRMQAPKDKIDDPRSEFERWTSLLAACNLKLVPCSSVAVDPDELFAIRTLARARLHADDTAGEL